jgi:type II secretory pathway component PulC
VTLKDPKIAIADVYKVGQKIIDHNDYELYKIVDGSSVEFIRDTKKVCVSLLPDKLKDSVSKSSSKDGPSIKITSAFVKEQLGPGFSKVLNSARLIPQIIEGKTTGFKIFSIAKESLFDKLELSNGDVIKNVNGINLQDPAQGFKIYEAFQDENNITIQIDRNGETLTKRVTVE